MINQVRRALFTKPKKSTRFEIRATAGTRFVLRTLTPYGSAWAQEFLGEPTAHGDRLVSGAIVVAIAADAMKRGYLLRFI